MAKRAFTYKTFVGGQATDKKIGIKYSFANSESIDFRKSPSQFSLLSQPQADTSGIIDDLIQNEVMTDDGVIYSLGSTGNIYQRKTDGTFTVFGNIGSGGYGMVYRPDQDAIYLAGDTTVSSITTVSTNPTLNINAYGISQSTYNNNDNTPGINVNCDQSSGALTTSIKTSISEGDMLRRYFQTDIEPLNKIAVQVAAKGTGDWTLTLHDGLNNTLATSTITNTNLSNGQWAYFVFSDQIRVTVAPAAQTYHFHITSTVNDGTVYSTATNNLSSCNMQLWADRLVRTSNGFHPMTQIQQYIVIGNGRYLSVWEPLGDPNPSNTEWARHYLQFPPDLEVNSIDAMNEYLGILTQRVSTDGNYNPNSGVLFWWDGIQKAASNVPIGAYNYFTPIPDGTPQGAHTYRNVFYYEAGGSWYAVTSVDTQPQKIRLLPSGENGYDNNNNQTIIYPYATTTRNGIQLMAWPSKTINTNITYGVYSWGQVDTSMPTSFGLNYLLSTGKRNYTLGNNLTIGMVKSFGNTLHISWRDDEHSPNKYGLDILTATSPLPSTAKWESLIFDNGYVGKYKQADYMDVTWYDLPDNVEIVLKYSIDRGDWVYSERFSNTNQWNGLNGYASFSIGESTEQARFHEIQVGIDIYTTGSVYLTPKITSCTLIFDDLSSENLNNT